MAAATAGIREQLLMGTYHTATFVHTQPVHVCRQIVNICYLIRRGRQLRHGHRQIGCPCCSHYGLAECRRLCGYL